MFIPYYLRSISKLSEVRLASIHYLNTWNTSIKITFSFSLYIVLLLVIQVIYFGKATENDWEINIERGVITNTGR